MKKTRCILAIISLSGSLFAQGSLTPPGAPAPTMKTLAEIDAAIANVGTAVSQIQGEARTPISQAGTTITTPGSYILTTNLVSTGGGSGVNISTNNVTVDLNGFSILCAGANGQGISMAGCNNVTIKNGTIRDAYYFGIAAYHTQNCQFENLIITGNGRASSSYDGIHAGTNILITGCTVTENGSGIELDGPGGIITSNRIIDNGSDGIKLNSSGSHVAENIVKGNDDNYDFAAGNTLNLLLSEAETLDWPCSVKLARSLVYEGSDRLDVKSDDVTIDLAGYTLTGHSNSLDGIYQWSGYKNLTIRNGTIKGFSRASFAAVQTLGSNVRIENMILEGNDNGLEVGGTPTTVKNCEMSDNTGYGIYTTAKLIVTDCSFYRNGLEGLHVGDESLINNCQAIDNAGNGIYAGDSTLIANCTASGNQGSYAIHAGGYSTLRSCVASKNSCDRGIHVGYRSSVIDCTASENVGSGSPYTCGIYANHGSLISGCTAGGNSHSNQTTATQGCGIYTTASAVQDCNVSYNQGHGIYSSSDSHLLNNYCRANGNGGDGAGIRITSNDNRIEGNSLLDNDEGIKVTSSGNFIVRNSAGSNGTNYYTLGVQTIGPIVTATGTITNTNPWANFEY